MKATYESIFMSSLRALCVTLCIMFGLTLTFVGIAFGYYGLKKATHEESYPSKVKLLPDAQGQRTKLAKSAPVILQIDIDGKIGMGKLTATEIEEILLDSREDIFKERPVKAILLVINSPGGGANDSDVIYRLVKDYKEQYKVPVFAYVNGLCASGGYYIACAADKIYASDVSLVGSIGVLSWPPFVNLVDAMNKLGVSALTVSAGEGKDKMNPFRVWNADEQKQYQTLLDFLYGSFVNTVVSNRPIDKDTLVDSIGARVFPAPEALSLGLIDHCCTTRNEALTELVKAAQIEGKYQVVGFTTSSWWKKYFKEEALSPLITGKIKHELVLPTNDGNPFSYIFAP